MQLNDLLSLSKSCRPFRIYIELREGEPEKHLLASDLNTCENLLCSYQFYFLFDFELVGQLLKPNENCHFGAQTQKLHTKFSSFVKMKVIEKEVVEVKKQNNRCPLSY